MLMYGTKKGENNDMYNYVVDGTKGQDYRYVSGRCKWAALPPSSIVAMLTVD